MAFTCAEVFAARGDEWNSPNFQHHVDSYFMKTDPDGTRYAVDRRLIDGYDVVPHRAKPHRAEPRPKFVDPKGRPSDKSMNLVVNQLLRLRRNGLPKR